MTPELTLTTLSRDLLAAEISTPVVAQADTATQPRPYFVFSTSGAENIHPRIVRLLLTLALETRPDITTATDAAALHYAATAAFTERLLTLRSNLQAAGYGLLRFVPASLSDTETPGEERHRTLTQSWTIHLVH
jgi:hypothetical protein